MNLFTNWPAQFGHNSNTGGMFTQAGTGNPTPANVRAITPWKAASAATTIKRCGKNLIPLGSVSFTQLSTYAPAGLLIPAGTYKFSAVINSADVDSTVCAILFNPPGTGTSFFRHATNRQSATVTFTSPVTSVTFYASNTYVNGAGDTASFADIQLEPGSTLTAYEAYLEKTASLAAPEILYSGYLGHNWNWGRTAQGIILDGSTETWDDTNFAASGYFETTLAKACHATTGLACSHFTPATSAAADSNKIIVSGTSLKLYPADAVATTEAELITWLGSNNTTVAYNLGTPDVITPIFP